MNTDFNPGDEIEIVSVSRGQQYDIGRPVEVGAKGKIAEGDPMVETIYVNLTDPKDGRPCRMWFHYFDIKKV